MSAERNSMLVMKLSECELLVQMLKVRHLPNVHSFGKRSVCHSATKWACHSQKGKINEEEWRSRWEINYFMKFGRPYYYRGKKHVANTSSQLILTPFT